MLAVMWAVAAFNRSVSSLASTRRSSNAARTAFSHSSYTSRATTSSCSTVAGLVESGAGASGFARAHGRVLALGVYVDVLTEPPDVLALLFRRDGETLEIEGRAEPRPVELDHPHPQLKILYRYLLFIHLDKVSDFRAES